MAGLSLYFEDGHDDLDDFGFDDYGSECDGIRITAFLDAGQDNLTPLGRLEKYAFSENVFNRQIVARGLLDVLREFSDNENDFISVMETVARMSEDGEPTVRAELMEQVPNIAMFLHESQPNFPAAFSRYLVPIVVRYLTDPNNQVRKTSQAALLVLLEQGLICKGDMETKVCPVLLDLTEPSSDDDYKIEAVAIMCKLVTMLSKDTVEQLLQRFCELCSDARLFQVRKVCAANFGEFCSIVGRDATEKLLMSKFFDLCSDSLWGIRKACADCFMIVSNSTSPEVRRTKLSPLFSSLISDQSRWVRQAAFQSLGRFISTFANPSSTGLYFKEDGTLLEVPRCPSDSNSPLCIESSMRCSSNGHRVRPSNTPINQDGRSTPSLESMSRGDSGSDSTHTPPRNRHEGQVHNNNPPPTNNKNKETAQTDQNFNSFHYWRPPLADISQELEMLKCQGPRTQTEGEKEEVVGLEDGEMTSLQPATSSQIQKVLDCLQPHMDDPDVQAQVQVLSAALKAAQLESQSEEEEMKGQSESQSEEEEEVEGQSESQSPEDGDKESSQNRLTTEETQTPEPPTKQARDPEPTEEQKENKAEEETEKELEEEAEPQESPPDSPFLVRDDPDHSSMESELMESAEEEGKEDSAFNQVCEEKSKVQNVIPQQLLEQYLSMTDPAQAQTVDTEIAKHCAFSLPGVALTLGRQNWHCLKDTYETLATDVQWKVRRTLAFSIHDLALILGDQLTAADLVPIFNGFLKDLDEVRIGVLKHLYDFLKLLHAEKRREYLYQLQEFMVTDNSRNWRFRYQLAEQLILIIELYSHYDVYNYLRQIALTLCSDKVSEVRWISYKLVVEILQKMYACGAHELGLNFINELIVRFCHCPKWVGRQAFAFICQAIVEEDCMPMDQFAQHLLPSLLSLSLDPVANVRVLVAKALRQSVMEKAYFKEPGSAYLDELEETVMALQADKDRDVRFFASLDPNMVLMDTAALNQNQTDSLDPNMVLMDTAALNQNQTDSLDPNMVLMDTAALNQNQTDSLDPNMVLMDMAALI
ncbi:serine/threonine-protein phosphatase 4 regulatory subunit 1 isoform X6 [Coregonus clupeaformis]|uniref:serine/threonine-protein phosphatase 4 regulatory subunit 1 isoform X5 n=1 Tax=Coregonus clupeaformis TaxID=59861 RepID=UPI001BE0F82B|nr:serine/threonine-protein phosphatase 4 regulatory subunit 1 isoform X5 [Coregonus clupeaformis]XP_045079599.1 serine/threonine-protein phosphatase 4 regulatory subunit 1 isoform X4 [Coregonus clupeaformis]XP_045079600.1 serine/threonine-protein phosphatase 4 regulatory subunit 1 isoform X6 [Coregonus clupeaformis]